MITRKTSLALGEGVALSCGVGVRVGVKVGVREGVKVGLGIGVAVQTVAVSVWTIWVRFASRVA